MSLEAVLVPRPNVRDLVEVPKREPLVPRIWEMPESQRANMTDSLAECIRGNNDPLGFLEQIYIIDPNSEVISANRQRLVRLANRKLKKANDLGEVDNQLIALASLKILGKDIDISSITPKMEIEIRKEIKSPAYLSWLFVNYAIIAGSTDALNLSSDDKERILQGYNSRLKFELSEMLALRFAGIDPFEFFDRNKKLDEINTIFQRRVERFDGELDYIDAFYMAEAKLLSAHTVSFKNGILHVDTEPNEPELSIPAPLPETRRFA